MTALCSRPHEKFVDFYAGRFVVCKWRGLELGHAKLECGDELPSGALSERALRLAYRARRIETVEYAATDPTLREACAQRGVSLDAKALQPAAPVKISNDLDKLSRAELAKLCEKYAINTNGSKDDLRQRLATLVV